MNILTRALCLMLLIAGTNSYAANLSFDIGKNSSGISAGRDLKFGYIMLGISTKFNTDSPWSYVPTRQSLDSACQDFKDVNVKNCDPRGRFNDGDEWEVYGKLGYRLPVISRVFLNTGIGFAKQRKADLYIFREDIKLRGGVTSEFMETWGHVEDHYYLTFLGGLGFSITRSMLFNIDYHSRQGLLGGIMYRF